MRQENAVTRKMNALLQELQESESAPEAAKAMLALAKEYQFDDVLYPQSLSALTYLTLYYHGRDDALDAQVRDGFRAIAVKHPASTERALLADYFVVAPHWNQVRGELTVDIALEQLKLHPERADQTFAGLPAILKKTRVAIDSEGNSVDALVVTRAAVDLPEQSAAFLVRRMENPPSKELVALLAAMPTIDRFAKAIAKAAATIDSSIPNASDLQFNTGRTLMAVAAAIRAESPDRANGIFKEAKALYSSANDAELDYRELCKPKLPTGEKTVEGKLLAGGNDLGIK
jgi:hypothetical protein